MESPYAAENKMSYWDERMTLEYIKKLNKIFRELQKLERDLLMLLKERRKIVQTGFDTLIMREDAANILGLCTRQFDRIVKSGQAPRIQHHIRCPVPDGRRYCLRPDAGRSEQRPAFLSDITLGARK